jgi:hypothetical protein
MSNSVTAHRTNRRRPALSGVVPPVRVIYFPDYHAQPRQARPRLASAPAWLWESRRVSRRPSTRSPVIPRTGGKCGGKPVDGRASAPSRQAAAPRRKLAPTTAQAAQPSPLSAPGMRLHTAEGARKYLTASERDAFLRQAELADRGVRTLCMTLAFAGCRLSYVQTRRDRHLGGEESMQIVGWSRQALSSAGPASSPWATDVARPPQHPTTLHALIGHADDFVSHGARGWWQCGRGSGRGGERDRRAKDQAPSPPRRASARQAPPPSRAR